MLGGIQHNWFLYGVFIPVYYYSCLFSFCISLLFPFVFSYTFMSVFYFHIFLGGWYELVSFIRDFYRSMGERLLTNGYTSEENVPSHPVLFLFILEMDSKGHLPLVLPPKSYMCLCDFFYAHVSGGTTTPCLGIKFLMTKTKTKTKQQQKAPNHRIREIGLIQRNQINP